MYSYIIYYIYLLITVVLHYIVTVGSTTGVYVDNGVQTIKQELMTAEERTEVEQEILTMFGVPKVPRKSPKNLDGSAPQFLFDIYRAIQQDGQHDRKTRSVSDIGQYDDHTVQDSDVIITLYLSNHCKYLLNINSCKQSYVLVISLGTQVPISFTKNFIQNIMFIKKI